MTRERGKRVLSQVDIEGMIVDDLDLLEEATEAYGDLLEAEARAESEYKRKFNRIYFQMEKGGHESRKIYAESQCEDERDAYKMAAALTAGQKEILWTIRGRIDAVRSLNANVRSQV